MKMKYEWCEVYMDELAEPPYVLLLLKETDGLFVVYDPAEKSFAFASKNYDAARQYVNEDGYYTVNEQRISIPRD